MTVAVDTSVSVAYLLRSHAHHRLVRARLGGRELRLTGHSLAETYSVLTRLPGDARVSAADAVRLIDDNFAVVVALPVAAARRTHATLAAAQISGGAAYDGLVALAARSAGLPLASRDARAAATYRALGVEVELIAE